ncbi:single-stranded-DNA-specific exonuclease RecJ [Haloarcula salinisoli]|uniref:DHH family phosphoesterase n=1 Tax=Haloarcula salinisoli TaxID=2487746 RepID=A0A8J8C8Q8_9EURY|nr:DHH family phosphoesterase [Halomicroarcula salinisoli]MBX0287658.1 DHH family phosphoesterase [Halomicroarcula salinisoli]MBX0304587.1 DHH family phosphoesterase [Halomicroarcula salinisoli]
MSVPVPALADRATASADRLRAADRVLLASHIDADGLTSAAIASAALARAGIPVETVFKKQLDADEIASIAARDEETVLFTDFGSGQLDVISEHVAAGDFEAVVADHHQPADPAECHPDAVHDTDGYADFDYHCNPLLVGINGASELSGAGAAYVLARALEPDDGDNRDLAALAVVGAVGDMQAVGGELVGANSGIVEEGVAADVLTEGTDLSLYGKQTRPLPKLLEYATEVPIPGISNDQAGATRFLEKLGLDLKRQGEWRTWADLTDDERQTVASALVQRAVKRGVPAEKIESLVGTTYTLTAEPTGTELRDASEFSTLLNATARYERADVGLAVCLGDRKAPLEQARKLLANHRRNLSQGLDLVKERGITHAEHVQYFDAGDAIRETIVGIVAGMALGTDGVDADKPIIAFADADGETKVSARATGPLVGRGVDLSVVMGEAARSVGGDGGGHDIAAGATVPAGEEDAFIAAADDIVADQLG